MRSHGDGCTAPTITAAAEAAVAWAPLTRDFVGGARRSTIPYTHVDGGKGRTSLLAYRNCEVALHHTKDETLPAVRVVHQDLIAGRRDNWRSDDERSSSVIPPSWRKFFVRRSVSLCR